MSLKAILFDFGGTLDADGIAWPERFFPLYREHGITDSRELFLKAFYRSDDELPGRHRLRGLGLEETLRLQVQGVLESLAPDRLELGPPLARRFAQESRELFRRNRPFLERLARSHRLGVVSNFYGNLDSVLETEGLSHLFGAIADSVSLGASKPDSRIFLYATARLGVSPAEALMVGDSAERDMRGAEALSMPHAFLRASRPASCCPQARVLSRLTDLEASLEGVPS